LPDVALACNPEIIPAVTINLGCVLAGVGEAVMVIVEVAVTEPFAFEVAVTV